jgi:hypothetical protein
MKNKEIKEVNLNTHDKFKHLIGQRINSITLYSNNAIVIETDNGQKLETSYNDFEGVTVVNGEVVELEFIR